MIELSKKMIRVHKGMSPVSPMSYGILRFRQLPGGGGLFGLGPGNKVMVN